jgi:hypothetical protein
MKRRIFLLFAIVSIVGMIVIGGCNGNEKKSEAEIDDSKLNGHEYVDLGLSVKWATCNVGASNPHEYGDFFAWGETKPKTTFTEKNYNFFSDPAVLPSDADAATVNWGNGWRMPTKAECDELVNNCKWTWLDNGYKVVGPNGNGIFLPATGSRRNSDIAGVDYVGLYWSSSLYVDHQGRAWSLYSNSGYCCIFEYWRTDGLTVRPVCDQ